MTSLEDTHSEQDSFWRKLNKPLTRRQSIVSLATAFGPPLLFSVYGVGIEPYAPKVDRVTLSLSDFPGTLRAVHLSDLHMHRENRLMARVLDWTNAFNADFIFLTGDLVGREKKLPACLQWIAKLKCKRCVYFVPGNREHWSGTLKNGLESKLLSIGVRTLNNAGEIIEWHDGNFFLTGIDDAYYGSPRPKQAFAGQPDGICTIMLSHSPVGVRLIKQFRCDLVLAGHTHGGQVRIPGIGAVETPPGSGPFEQGLYQVASTQLYVNRGIGTSIIPIRFRCPPEVTYLTIQGK